MKVLFINAVYGISSTGRIVKELDEAMRADGVESCVATTKTNIDCQGLYMIGNRLDWKIHGMLSRIFGKQAYFSYLSTHKLLQYIKRENPDIVHLHNLHGNYINFPMLLKYLSDNDIATVVTLHDCWFFTGKCTHYTETKCNRWKTGCYDCPKLKDDNRSWFFDRTPEMWDDRKKLFEQIPRLAVIGVSDWVTHEAKNSILKNAQIIERIYNWIDLDVFCPQSGKKTNSSKFQILAISAGWNTSSSKWKDLLTLSQLIREDMQIIVVGGGLTHVSVPHNMIVFDYINGLDKLAELYSSVDVYVHLSREDTFGKVVAEAMACGTPSVVYDSTGLPELIEDGCGYVVPTGNITEMFEKILLIQEAGKETFSEKCINSVKSRFSKEQLIGDTMQLYKDILNISK